MQIEIEGWRFAVDVEHYSPAVAGTYSYTADSDATYYGSAPELSFRVSDVDDLEESEISFDVNEVVDEYYSIIYNKIIEQMAVN